MYQTHASFSNYYLMTIESAHPCLHYLVLMYLWFSPYSREFSHRVKSVSLSTFTNQEVEALQRGGNQVNLSSTLILNKNDSFRFLS